MTNTTTTTAKPPAPDNGEIETYRKFVIAAAESGEMIYNRTPAHAAVIIECLFRKSKSQVDVLTGTLDPVVYGTAGAIAAASEFLRQPNAKLTILHDGDLSNDHPMVRSLNAIAGPDRFSVERVSAALAKTYPYHFAVGDQCHFRFEKQKENCEAVAQFGNERGGLNLTNEFNRLRTALSSMTQF